WNDDATRAMFGKKITIKTEKNALKLYRHIFRDINSVPLLKHLHFELNNDYLPYSIEELLYMTFTPSMQRLTGSVKAEKFFNTLFDIANSSRASFDQLEDLPKYTGASEAIRNERLLRFGSIVRSYTLTVPQSGTSTNDTIIWKDYFHTFRNLTTLTLQGHPNELNGIEGQIKGCHHLNTLNLQDILYGEQIMAQMTTEKVISWATHNVSKETTLKNLNISTVCRPELIEYLLFKYPNTANITIIGELWYPNDDLVVAQENLSRVFHGIREVSHKKVELTLPPNITFRDIKETFKISIKSQMYLPDKLLMKIN
ncbi:hypothetical protein MBANPS3_007970, partial [Mucor bainieri]